MYKLGFREFILADDIFTSDQNWAKEVCNRKKNRAVNLSALFILQVLWFKIIFYDPNNDIIL